MQAPIQFFFREQLQSIADAPATRTVLQWLREDQRACGTKEGCAEGDCGACTVVVGRLDAAGRLQTRPLNACIAPLASLHGQALFTVEDLSKADAPLHPCQQTMVDCHGSQCGFCTPGFVMSLAALYAHRTTAPDDETVHVALGGNLCRCTGYLPIVAAAKTMFEAPRRDWIPAGTASALANLNAGPAHTQDADGSMAIVPLTEDALAEVLERHPDATIVGGATDVGLWITKLFKPLKKLVFTHAVTGMHKVEVDAASIIIGGAATLREIEPALLAEYPELTEWLRRYAGPPVRAAATMAGNIANGSPIGDSMPVLLALGCVLHLRCGDARRAVDLNQFYLGYQKKDLRPGEFISSIVVPQRPPGMQLSVYKISKRFDDDISAVCAAFALRIESGVVQHVRIGFGGMAATPMRALQTEAALLGKLWSEQTINAAMRVLENEFKPISDHRATAAYRSRVSANLLRRLWLQTQGEATRVIAYSAKVTA